MYIYIYVTVTQITEVLDYVYPITTTKITTRPSVCC